MKEVFLSEKADARLVSYLSGEGYEVRLVPADARLGAIGDHPDLSMTKLGALPSSPVLPGDPAVFAPDYPQNAACCAVCLDRYILHRRDITAPALKREADRLGLVPINVRQGYAKCACVVVDGSAVITADRGILRALREHPDIAVLPIGEGHVALPGYDTGFLGGASGRVGDEIVFNGDLSRHPDFARIVDFIASRSLGVRFFREYPLTDIGSIIEHIY